MYSPCLTRVNCATFTASHNEVSCLRWLQMWDCIGWCVQSACSVWTVQAFCRRGQHKTHQPSAALGMWTGVGEFSICMWAAVHLCMFEYSNFTHFELAEASRAHVDWRRHHRQIGVWISIVRTSFSQPRPSHKRLFDMIADYVGLHAECMKRQGRVARDMQQHHHRTIARYTIR